jgi:type II secretory pathway component PulC
MFVLFNIIFSSIATLVSPKLSMLYSLFIFIPALAVTVRRLHDVGKSGWMIFITFIPLIGVFWLLILLFRKGDLEQVIKGNINSSNQQNNKDESSEINNTNYSNVVDSKINDEKVVVEEKPVNDVDDSEITLEDGFS